MDRKCDDCGQLVPLANASGFPSGWVSTSPSEVVCQADLWRRNMRVAADRAREQK